MDFGNFEILYVGSSAYPCGTLIKKHEHTFFHFLYVEDGVGDAVIDEQDYSLTKGNIYLFSPGVSHMFYNSSEKLFKICEIKFKLNDPEAEKLISELPLVMHIGNSSVRTQLLSIYEENLLKENLFNEIIGHKFQLMLTYLLREHQNLKKNPTVDGEVEKCPPEINRVLKFICENYGQKISLEQLADIAGYEKNYFLRKFKKIKNCTPIVFLRTVRLEKAKELLSSSDLTVSQVASMIGFETVHHFSNFFLKYAGMRPMTYREENKTSYLFIG